MRTIILVALAALAVFGMGVYVHQLTSERDAAIARAEQEGTQRQIIEEAFTTLQAGDTARSESATRYRKALEADTQDVLDVVLPASVLSGLCSVKPDASVCPVPDAGRP